MMNSHTFFKAIVKGRSQGIAKGIYSVCSAHPIVLEASMENARDNNSPILIESTANQVNQLGGYTGMTPAIFRALVLDIAARCGMPEERIMLGGDHLGPFVWRDRSAEEAMSLSEDLIQSYVEAGFIKIHLDTSMPLGDDPRDEGISNELIASRGARLCLVAETAYEKNKRVSDSSLSPLYVIGSEVPTPGGPQEEVKIEVTRPQDFLSSYAAFRSEFRKKGLHSALNRVIAFVIQPGVEFSDKTVVNYDSDKARNLCACLDPITPPLVFEGHSTDYQTKNALRSMVTDGIAILKVGPALTFSLREGLVALERIEEEILPIMDPGTKVSAFSETLESTMLSDDRYWKPYYAGTEAEKKLARRFSYSDRARYYLQSPGVTDAIDRLLSNLERISIPETLIRQYLPHSYQCLRLGTVRNSARELLKQHIKQTLADYDEAVGFSAL